VREVVTNARQANLLHWHNASRAALESPDLARKVRDVLERSGGMLVKLGQIASTRGDILPPAMIDELANLRADVVPVDAAGVRGVLEAELGVPVEHAFQSFDWTPLAAASIGQTHRAVLHDGTRVVVKVQRPGVRDVVERDAAVLRLMARQLERRVEAARIIGLRSLCDELIAGLEEELDYHHEAMVATRLRERRASDVGIAVPCVYPTLSTGRVLVMEEVEAKTIADEKAVETCPVARHDLAMNVLSSFIGQVLDDGFFHADPHPGNLLVDPQGTIWLLDFGSVGRLDSNALNGLRGIAIGIATNDAGVLARAARDLSTSNKVVDLRALESELAAPLAELDESGGVNPEMIAQVLSVMTHHEMRPPASVTLLGRALVTLEGTLRVLEPDFSMADASKDLVRQHRGAFGSPREILQREMLRVLPALRTLPEHAEAIASQLRGGSLTVRTERYAGGDRDVVDRWVDRAVLAGIGGFAGVASALLLVAAAATDNTKVQTALWILGFAGMTLAAILMLRGAARALRRHATRLD
jgi:ubiquinone biosynthesis protein